ncbi:MAG TPA: HD domain-containing phosphohydrolase [Pyrinomonadaceae bacterium]|nr:HD domain-containing phosphohydrolase [Pyrinomonadaceae bacterium]
MKLFLLASGLFLSGLFVSYALDKSLPVVVALNAPALCLFFLISRRHIRRLEEENADAARRLREVEVTAVVRLRTVEALAAAIDAKDQTPRGHVRRTRVYAVETGRLLGLGGRELAALGDGALLHDVGKLAVPEYVLNKPDRLTAAEFERMKTHTTVGAALLDGVGFPYPVEDVVLYHHERWDGGGYPAGLKGEQIPLVARIIAVVDFYDSTRCGRPFRAGVPRHESLSLLERRAGTAFDPRVVETFVRHVEEFDALIDAADLREQAMCTTNVGPAKSEFLQAPAPGARGETEGPAGFRSISEAQREVFALHEIAHTVGRSLDLEDTFDLISGKLRAVMSFDTCVIHVLDEKSGSAYAAHVAGADEEYFSGRRVPVGRGVTGWVISNARSMRSASPELDLADAPDELRSRVRSVVAAPLVRDGAAYGAVALYSSDETPYTSEHLRLLETVALYASNAISNSLTFVKTRENALADPLTGLQNERALRLLLEQRLAECRRRPDAPLAVLSLDIDDLGGVNGAHGHGVGDRLIAEAAGVIKAQLRQMDMLARCEADEFVAVMPAADAEAAGVVAERIRAAVESHRFTVRAGLTLRVGLSVGVACFPSRGETADDILLAAHADMERNKHIRKFESHGPGPGEVIRLDSYR